MAKTKIIDGSGDKKYFTIVPNYILNHSTHWDREVYIQMKRITGESGECWTSQKTLAKQCGMSISRLKKSIKYLSEHKWIKLIKQSTGGGEQKTNVYKLADLWRMNNCFYPESSSREKPTGVSSENDWGGREKPTKKNPIKEEPIKKKNIDILRISSERADKDIIEMIGLFEEVNPTYKKFYSNKTQRDAISRLLTLIGSESLAKVIKILPATNQQRYAPTITTPYQLEDKLANLKLFVQNKQKEQNKSTIVKI